MASSDKGVGLACESCCKEKRIWRVLLGQASYIYLGSKEAGASHRPSKLGVKALLREWPSKWGSLSQCDE